LVAVAAPVYVADQLTKAWASANLLPDQPRDLIGSVLRLNLTHNAGAAFSIGTGATWILTAIACSVVLFVVFTARRLGSRGWAVALGLLLGGSVGNLTDRMLRAPGPGRGRVVDFLQLPQWPIFNIADSAIVSAALLIGVLAFRRVSVDGTRMSGHTAKHEKAKHENAKHENAKHENAKHQPPKAESPKRVTGTPHDA
jgi:signal peptidase II